MTAGAFDTRLGSNPLGLGGLTCLRNEVVMDVQKLKEDAKVGIIEPAYVDYLKNLYITRILASRTEQIASTACVAYATYLNAEGINSDNYPLYLRVLLTNNKYAVDALLAGYDPEHYLDCVQPNTFIINNFIEILRRHRRNEVYERVLTVVYGYLAAVYNDPEEGYTLYQPNYVDVNAIGKFLDEDKDQDDELNRVILDVLLYISKLDPVHEQEADKRNVARHAARIRSDFFDDTRSLLQSMTDVILESVENPDLGTEPEYTYG